jgi:hypothetical protein
MTQQEGKEKAKKEGQGGRQQRRKTGGRKRQKKEMHGKNDKKKREAVCRPPTNIICAVGTRLLAS